jgi:hypothetical protein
MSLDNGSWNNIIYSAKLNIQSAVATAVGIEPDPNDLLINNSERKSEMAPIYSTFSLPIDYLAKESIFQLSSTVCSDLELVQTTGEKSMYEYLFQPTHKFGSLMIQEWKKNYTNDAEYLSETQLVIKDMNHFFSNNDVEEEKVDCDKLLKIWKETKEDNYFLEKYCYVEWDVLKTLNRSSGFLQILSIANIMSPLMSLMIPIVFLILPFILLKIRGIPITLSMYIEILKEIAKNHFIGKTIMTLGSVSFDKLVYLIMSFGLYLYQIYQNIIQCQRFHRNIYKINNDLMETRRYLDVIITKMERFCSLHKSKNSYYKFCMKTEEHYSKLKQLRDELQSIGSFDSGILSKIDQFGYLLKCYYRIHSNKEYEESLKYSFGFEGFLDNLTGVHKHLHSGKIATATFGKEEQTCKFIDQYYPAYLEQEHVKNDCKLDKNIIITGPNASGKTTMLKTTTINIIFSQQTGCGFYSSCVLNPYTHIHSYLNIPDTSERDSLFQAESRRCKEIIDSICVNKKENNCRHYCIFDELYSGTNPEEAAKSAYAFLKYLNKYENVDFILTTHYSSICNKFKKSKQIANYKMETLESPLKYTYKMKKGISKIQGAIKILEDMDYPKEIIDDVNNYVK